MSPSCAAPAWRATQEPGQDLSYFPWDISEAEETEGTVGNSRGTCRDVIFLLFFYQSYIYHDFIFSEFRSENSGLKAFFKKQNVWLLILNTVSILKWS